MTKRTEYNQLAASVNLSFLSWVNSCGQAVQRWLYPPFCTLCGGRGDGGLDLCRGCAGDLVRIEAACSRCATFLPRPGLCGQCQRQPPAFDRTVAAFAYQSPVDALIKRLKFHGDIRSARLLGMLMAERLGPAVDPPEVIVPVPLHVRRLRRRGFNQALELARPVARRLGLPVAWSAVSRIRATDPQSDLPAKLRSRNVRNAFAVAPGFTPRRVAIVDDVMTTGHTVDALACALRRAGAVDISVWVCARAVFGR